MFRSMFKATSLPLRYHGRVAHPGYTRVMAPFGTSTTMTVNPSYRPCPSTIATTSIIRTHMNHGNPGKNFEPPSLPQYGPRQPLRLGYDVSKASQNVLRLLEATHGIYAATFHFQDTTNPCWHDTGIRLGLVNGKWSRLDEDPSNHKRSIIPTISSLQFSDDRTALAKVQALDGSVRYLSILRIDPSIPSTPSSLNANDGWVIVREVVTSFPTLKQNPTLVQDDMTSLIQCLHNYFDIEHGGGEEHYQLGKKLFSPYASLFSVGISPIDQEPTEWTAPLGTFLEISLDTYLHDIWHQSPHDLASRQHDQIIQIDITPGGNAASAIVKVGNGAQTTVFVDHLLLGKEDHDDGTGSSWTILSKTFSPRKWDDDVV